MQLVPYFRPKLKQSTMENTTLEKLTFDLMEGDFTPWEAEKVLITFLDQKINLQKLRNLSYQEGNCAPNTEAMQRIKELQENKRLLQEAIGAAKSQGLKLKIHSKISVESV